MIRTWLFAAGTLRTGDETLVEVWKAETDSMIWVDFGEFELNRQHRIRGNRSGIYTPNRHTPARCDQRRF